MFGHKVTLSDLWYQLSNNVRALILLCAGAAVIAVIVSYAILHKVDRGLIRAPGCPQGVAWEWRKLPLFISPADGRLTADPAWRDPFVRAMDRFPIMLTIPALSTSATLGAGSSGIVSIEVVPADMIPSVCHEVPEGHGCTALAFRGCSIVSASIFVPEETAPWARTFVIAHEVGHALGLDHDDDRHSIMHEVVPRNDDFELLPTDWKAIIERSKAINPSARVDEEWLRSCVVVVGGMEWIRDEPRCREAPSTCLWCPPGANTWCSPARYNDDPVRDGNTL